jgi:transcription elongation factor S-II
VQIKQKRAVPASSRRKGKFHRSVTGFLNTESTGCSSNWEEFVGTLQPELISNNNNNFYFSFFTAFRQRIDFIMSKTAVQDVLNFKEALEKDLPLVISDDPSSAAVERIQDILERLSETRMTLEILTETLIGAVVNKFKSHKELGSTAKALVKQWKKVAAAQGHTTNVASTKPKSNSVKPEKVSPEERRGSMGSVTSGNDEYDPESEWTGLSEQRTLICQKLFEILLSAKPELMKEGVNEAAVLHLTAPRTAEIEAAIYAKYASANDRTGYADKARSICFNLKKNKPLAVELLLGHVDPSDLVNFTVEQLAAPETRRKREETAQKLIDSRRLDWDQANEDKINKQCGIQGELLQASLFTCGRCKSVKTTSTQKQTRSADEPMTVFVLCLNCGKRWKC